MKPKLNPLIAAWMTPGFLSLALALPLWAEAPKEEEKQDPETRSAQPGTPAPAPQPGLPITRRLGYLGGPSQNPPGFVGGIRREPDPQQDFIPIPDRWRLSMPAWQQHAGEGEYPYTRGAIYNPYNQNVLKGDYPILGDDKFFVFTAISDTVFEAREVPTPSGVSTRRAFSDAFFGDPQQYFVNQNFILSFEFFQGATAFKPRGWELRMTPVFSLNHLNLSENNGVDIDVREGDNRTDVHVGFQELLFEYHLSDLTDNYDFLSLRGGIQPFTSDFRSFLFIENQPGVRIFGNWATNLYQYNLAYFRFIEKDSNSGLNEVFKDRRQDVLVANLYRQDFLWHGYTAQLSYHFNYDHGDTHFDDNRFLRRPSPVGDRALNEIRVHYLGWTGEGHIGRFNLSHAYYFAFGEESHNPIAQQEVDVLAHMVAVEPSIDFDWLRLKANFFYASGDGDPEDDVATGFDTIVDNPNFAGAGASYWQRQGIPLAGTALFLKNRNSLLPSLRSAKNEGQANFVNPGVVLMGAGADLRVTQKLRAELNVNYLMFDRPQSLELLTFQQQVERPLGIDTNLGLQYRPLLTDNIILTAGAALFQPLDGFSDIYESDNELYSLFLSITLVY